MKTSFANRFIAITFLLIFIQPMLGPYYAFALTTGPHQPEYTSYEAPGATDMVNITTGDFTFSIPILDVPGNGPGFSLPLSYHAGVGLDQEASWVGLGWTVNAGAITRSINEYPDDALGEQQSVTVQDLQGVRGWTSSMLGLGVIGWNSQVGHYGQVSLLGVSWDQNGVDVNPVQLGLTIVSIITVAGAVGTITSTAAKITASAKASAAITLGMEAIDKAQMISNNISAAQAPSAPGSGYWQYSRKTKQKLFHKEYKIWLDKTRYEQMYGTMYLGKINNYVTYSNGGTNLSIQVDNNGSVSNIEEFQKTNTLSTGIASDVNLHDSNNSEYKDVKSPAFLAYDDYSVNGPGISGSISPYRVDVGSVAMPREMTKYHRRFAPVKHSDYKVPFIYEGTMSNSHFYHVGSSNTNAPTAPSFYEGIQGISESSTLFKYSINDYVLKSTNKIKSGLNTSTPKIAQANHIEWMSNLEIKNSAAYTSGFIDFLSRSHSNGYQYSDRYKFRSNFLVGNVGVPSIAYSYTDYFTSGSNNTLEIPVDNSTFSSLTNGQTVTLNFQFFYTDEDVANGSGYNAHTISTSITKSTSSITIPWDASWMNSFSGSKASIEIEYYNTPQIQNSIGGYAITSAEGMTYHYALPVYDYEYQSEMQDQTNRTQKKTVIKRKSPFANTWLLTAITGPDFVDRNSDGLANEGDWGHWIIFNYGRHSDSYQWRIPFEGDRKSSDDNFYVYSQGTKQLYYLNSIESQSHIALFLKSSRYDSRSVNGIQPLKLDEIVLLTKERYRHLTQVIDTGIPNFTHQIENVSLKSRFDVPNVRQFINAYAQRRILFNYDYDLCKQTPNSTYDATFNPNQGKLTLKSLSVIGQNNAKVAPDYIFQYNNNPVYSQHHWDGWGLYNPFGSLSGKSHSASNYDNHGTAWSITKVITPLGSEIIPEYERDEFSNLGGDQIVFPSKPYSNTNRLLYNFNRVYLPSTSEYAPGMRVRITSSVNYKCGSDQTTSNQYINKEFTIVGVESDFLELDDNYINTCGGYSNYTIVSESGSVKIIDLNKKGGNLRVKSITLRDGLGAEYKTRYIYTIDGNPTTKSSGAVSKLSDYENIPFTNPLKEVPLYPYTPVIYEKVTILNGKLSNDYDYHTKTVYSFEGPSVNLVTNTPLNILPKTRVYYGGVPIKEEFAEIYHHKIENRTSRIGALKAINVYKKSSNNDVPVSTTTMMYTETPKNNGTNNYQGIFSDGVIMAERVEETAGLKWLHKYNKTTVLHYPYTVEKVVTNRDGLENTEENVNWDFLTGEVLEKVATSPLGLKVKTVNTPAYTISEYAQMGSKANNSANKNMLMQLACSYTYLLDQQGSIQGLLSGEAQKWKNDWANYRKYTGNSTSGQFYESSEGPQIWRKSASYIWEGSYDRKRSDGSQTFNSSDKFNFAANSSNPGWLYLGGDSIRVNSRGMVLQNDYKKKTYSATKFGYDDQLIIASATNALYKEVAFSGAEDLASDKPFFGGEVGIGSGVLTSSTSHTGLYALKLINGNGFIFKSNAIGQNRKYRVSVWSNSQNAQFYYRVNGAAELTVSKTVSPAISKLNGSTWYRIDGVITTPNSPITSFEVGVKGTGSEVIYDDFRFQPVQSSMKCFVYDPYLQFETYTLDDNNLFTRYEYNDQGVLIKTYQESLTYGEKLISESKSNYRRFFINP